MNQDKDEEGCPRCRLARHLGFGCCTDARLYILEELRKGTREILDKFAEKVTAAKQSGVSEERINELRTVVQIFLTELYLTMAASASVPTGETVGEFVRTAADTWVATREGHEALNQLLNRINGAQVKHEAKRNGPDN